MLNLFIAIEKEALASNSGQYENCCAEVNEFKKYIEEKRKLMIAQLSSDRMTIKEAYERLREIDY